MNFLTTVKKHRELSMAFTFILRRGLSHTLPYHNFNHCLTVMKYCYLACIKYKFQAEREKSLLIAALFHDMNHSGGATVDRENIDSAILSYNNFVAYCGLAGILDDNLIITCIQATEYPYVQDFDELPLEGRIIRDADLMSIFEPDWMQSVILGLAKEGGVGLPEQITNQIKFLERLEFNTDWANEIKDNVWFQVQSNMQDFKELFNQTLK